MRRFCASLIAALCIAACADGGGGVGSDHGPAGPGTFAITTPSVPAGQEGAAYSAVINATAGHPAYVWTLSGALPLGLSLDTTAVASATTLSGTPTTAGGYNFTVTCSVPATGDSASQIYGVTIAPAGGSGPHPSTAVEGYGSTTQGALSAPGGYTTFTVTTLADSGAGSLRAAVSADARLIEFAVGGTITLQTDLYIKNRQYITLAGETAPSPGITIRPVSMQDGVMGIAGGHDIVVRYIRWHGVYTGPNPPQNNEGGVFGVDGDISPNYIAERIVIDHCTFRNAGDSGPDLWGELADVTVQWCLMFYNWHPSTVSHYPGPYQTRRRISMHHNVYAKNGERNPQMRADVRDFDYVNNIVYDWGYYSNGTWGYGLRVKNEPGEPKVNMNIVNNYFLLSGVAPHTRHSDALTYGLNAGPDANENGPSNPVAQGTLVTNSGMGDIWCLGNVLPAQNVDHYSTISAPLSIPGWAQVTTWPATNLEAEVLPYAGTHFRTTAETNLINEIAQEIP